MEKTVKPQVGLGSWQGSGQKEGAGQVSLPSLHVLLQLPTFRSQLLLPPVTLEMALLLLLVGGFWVQVVSPQLSENATMLPSTPYTKVPVTAEALPVNSTVSVRPVTVDPNETISMWGPVTVNPSETISTWGQTPAPASSTPLGTTGFASLGIPVGASMAIPTLEPTTSQEVSTKTSVLLPEPSAVASHSPVTTANPVTDTTETFTSPETSKGTSAPPVTMTTSSKATGGPSVATRVSSTISGPPVTMAAGSPGPSTETHGHPVTIAASSVESSSVAGGTPVSNLKTSTVPTSQPITNRTSHQKSSSMFLVPMLVSLLVVLFLVVLLLLWRRRQKRRTGALTLNRGGKRNGVVDAWAGPATVSDEEAAAATASGPRGSKGSEAVDTEGSGQRPTLTTFFGRRKSRQGSVVMEELKPGSGPNLKGEEEPLVCSEEEAVETPTSDGLQDKAGAAPQSL